MHCAFVVVPLFSVISLVSSHCIFIVGLSKHLRSREEAGQWWLERGSLGGPGSNYNLNTYPQFEPEVPSSLPRCVPPVAPVAPLAPSPFQRFLRERLHAVLASIAVLTFLAPLSSKLFFAPYPVLAPCQRDMGASAERRESRAVGMDEQALPHPLVQYSS
jgi:hypothetical protein